MKNFIYSLLLILAGCVTPHNYNDPVKPELVTIKQLAEHADNLETLYQRNHQVNGIPFQAYRSDLSLDDPDFKGNGGDSMIFGGHKLAADVFRYATVSTTENLDKVMQSLRGMYILTHATGTPGVLARCAFPADRANEWKYPEKWGHRIENGFVHTGPVFTDPFDSTKTIGPMIYYTRATKDQLTGLLFGLAVTLEIMPEAQIGTPEMQAKVDLCIQTVNTIMEDVYTYLENNNFTIVDEKGENDTNADVVDELMLLQVLAVYRITSLSTNPAKAPHVSKEYWKKFDCSFFTLGDLFHRWSNYTQYFAWNLRYLGGYTVFLLDYDTSHRARIKDWYQDRLWQFTSGHLNTKFTYFYNVVVGTGEKLDEALFALKSLSLKPVRSYPSPLAGDERKPSFLQVTFGDWDRYVLPPHLRKPTSYSTWQKEPWDVGSASSDGRENAIGIDYLLAYWLGRYYQFVSEN